jgi:hypothetical protein
LYFKHFFNICSTMNITRMIYSWVYQLLPRVVDHDWGGGVGAGVPGILAVGATGHI